MKKIRFPKEIQAALLHARGVEGRQGKKTSIYLRNEVASKLAEATEVWKIPSSSIMNVALLRFLKDAGF